MKVFEALRLENIYDPIVIVSVGEAQLFVPSHQLSREYNTNINSKKHPPYKSVIFAGSSPC